MQISGMYEYFEKMFADVQDVWAVSDTHFGDTDLRAGLPHRPSDDEIVKLINSKCGKSSALIHLGDVGDVSYIPKLRAKVKILVAGNHDLGESNYKRQVIYKTFDSEQYTAESALAEMKQKYPGYKCTVSDEGFWWGVTADNQLFDYVFSGPVFFGEKLLLSHELLPGIPWAMNIHGHDHAGVTHDPCHHNVCLDATGYELCHLVAEIKSGLLSHIKSSKRCVIDKATERKKKRGGKGFGRYIQKQRYE